MEEKITNGKYWLVIAKYGKQFFIDFINTKDLLKWQLLYKKI